MIANDVVFDGSKRIRLVGSGELRSAPYRRMPVTDGHGMAISRGQGLNKYVGRYPDQAWSGSRPLRQVRYKHQVSRGKFWVGGGRIYVHRSAKDVRVSRLRSFTINGTLVGATIQRFSPTPADGAAVRLNGALKDVRILDSANVALQVTNRGVLDDVLIKRSGWMGISAVKCNSLKLDNVRIRRVNYHREWLTVPQSGAIKTSRCRNISADRLVVSKVTGHGIWFDQSTIDVDMTNVHTYKIDGRGLFFEISHGLTITNSLFTSKRPSKFAGASGVVITGTTFVPGYITPQDPRNCPDPKTPLCPGALASDRLTPYDRRITWVNDIVIR